jgi:hypothetical protein
VDCPDIESSPARPDGRARAYYTKPQKDNDAMGRISPGSMIHKCLWNVPFVWRFMVAVSVAAPIRALIVDGQSSHDWRQTTPVLKRLLEETGLFTVDVATSPAKGEDMSGFLPNFAAYKVVVLNYTDYDGDTWADAAQRAIERSGPARQRPQRTRADDDRLRQGPRL